MVHCQKTQWFNLIPIEILSKTKIVVERKCLCGIHQKINNRKKFHERMLKALKK
jgi:hypothetical protein